ncbi:hypothetical protein ACFX11_046730 [Malus domestica]
MDVEQDEEVGDAFVLQKAASEVERQGVGAGGDVSELLGDLEGEVECVVETQTTRQTRVTVVECSESEPQERPQAQLSIPGLRVTPTKKRIRAHAANSSKSSASVAEVGMRRKKTESLQ